VHHGLHRLPHMTALDGCCIADLLFVHNQSGRLQRKWQSVFWLMAEKTLMQLFIRTFL
jgi:hypothetical protein